MRRLLLIPLAAAALTAACALAPGHSRDEAQSDSLALDSALAVQAPAKNITLTEEDLKEIAETLGIDVPTIHAVIDIEAGHLHKGFWTEDKPVINFSIANFRRQAQRKGINLPQYSKSHAVMFANPNRSKYGSQQAAQQARLDAAMSIDSVAAIQSTYWGMFQIGGFNWKRCGASSPQDFYYRMSASERDQLELFADFLINTGLDKPLQTHDWRKFARGYNGSSYASRGYHTKLANAYSKYAKQQ